MMINRFMLPPFTLTIATAAGAIGLDDEAVLAWMEETATEQRPVGLDGFWTLS
jgi:hypothetical protein